MALESTTAQGAMILQAVPPSALVLAMALAYLLGFSGMLLAWLNYRKRKGGKGAAAQPPSSGAPEQKL